jgi:hypothetical protein
MMLESDTPVSSFPLGDQEILLRLLHKTARDRVEAYRLERARAAEDRA